MNYYIPILLLMFLSGFAVWPGDITAQEFAFGTDPVFEAAYDLQNQGTGFTGIGSAQSARPSPVLRFSGGGTSDGAARRVFHDPYAEEPVYRGTGSLIFWVMAAGIQVCVITGSLVSRWTTGAYIVGGFYAAASLGTIPLLINDEFFPYIILTAGTAALSWYNFAFAGSHSPTRKFLTNLISPNVMFAAFIGSLLVLNVMEPGSNTNLTLHAGPGGAGFVYRF